MSAPLLPQTVLDLTDITRDGLDARLIDLFVQANPGLADPTANHPENLLREGMAFLGHLLHASWNEEARQHYWATVTDRLAAIRLGTPFGFELHANRAASLSGEFYLPSSAVATQIVSLSGDDITSPTPESGVRVQAGQTVFRLPSAATIAVGANGTGAVALMQSELARSLVTSDGQAHQAFRLSQAPYVDGTIEVLAANGAYTRINVDTGLVWETFLEMGPSDRGYMFAVDQDGYPWVFFGNSIHGAIPQGVITADYEVGGGADGGVDAAASWNILDPSKITDATGQPATVLFRNTAGSSGGSDAMSVEEARVAGPLAYRTRRRIVNEDDATTVAASVAGIARAGCLTSNFDAIVPEDHFWVVLVAYGSAYGKNQPYPPASPSAAQIAEIQQMVNPGGACAAVMGLVATVKAATLETINIQATIALDGSASAADTETAVLAALRRLFAVADENKQQNPDVDFGYRLLSPDGVTPDYKIHWSSVLIAIAGSAGVLEVVPGAASLLLGGVQDSYTLQPRAFPLLGTVTLIDSTTGQTI